MIPDPAWKEKTFNGEIWRIGDTYNTAIGQYGLQITPIQAVTAVAALANGGKLVTPSILFTATSTVVSGTKIKGDPQNFQVVREGNAGQRGRRWYGGWFEYGSGGSGGQNGNGRIGSRKQFVNSWVIGFWPYQNLNMLFAVVMEKGPSWKPSRWHFCYTPAFDWMAVNRAEYLKNE